MIERETEMVDTDAQGWISGQGLWRVGFRRPAWPLINLMSGLVDIVDTIWDKDGETMVFIVRNLDVSGTLFRQGVLRANPIIKYRPGNQPVYVA
jgi:hypothetical protein